MNAKFLKLLKYFTINSLFVNLLDSTLPIFFFSVNEFVYILKYSNDEKTQQVYISYYWVYYRVFYTSIWSFFYTFGTSLDIFIVYERIQLYLPKLKFLKDKSALTI